MHYDANTLEQSIVQLAVDRQQATSAPLLFQQLQQAQAQAQKLQEQLGEAAKAIQIKNDSIAELTKQRDEARTALEVAKAVSAAAPAAEEPGDSQGEA